MNIEAFTRLGAPPQATAELNYADTEVNLTEKVNEEIDKNKQNIKDHYSHLIDIYNQQFKNEANRYGKIIDFAKGGKELYDKLDAMNKWQKEFKRLSGNYNHTATIVGVVDPDVDKYTKLQTLSDLNHKQRVEAANQAEAEGDIDSAIVLRNSITDLQNTVKMGSLQLAGENFDFLHELILRKAKVNWTKWHAENGRDIRNPDGSDMIKPLWEAVTKEERLFADGVALSFYLSANEDLAEGNKGQFKQLLVHPLLKKLEAKENGRFEEEARAATQAARVHRYNELATRIKEDPKYLSNHLDIYKADFGGSFREVRMDTFRILSDMAESGILSRAEVDKIVTTPFEAHDGTIQTPEDYWKDDVRKLRTAVQTFELREYEEEKADQEAFNKGLAAEYVDQWNKSEKPKTADARNDLLLSYMGKTGITDIRYIPDILKNLTYEGQLDDLQHERDLTHKYNKGEPITQADIDKFGDPVKKADWKGKLEKGKLKGDEKAARDRFLQAAVNGKTSETIGDPRSGNLTWQAYYRNAQLAFNRAYVASIEAGNSHSDAMKDGRDAVTAGLVDERWSTYDSNRTDLNTVTNTAKAQEALSKDLSLINSPNYLPGEKVILDNVLKTWNPENPKVPDYYKKIAVHVKDHDGYSIMLNRLESLGLLKDEKPVIPAQENLTRTEARLLSNKPNPSRTYRVTQNNEDIIWMLEQVQDPTAANNGGYDAVTNQEGEYTELEKPLSQHTIREVLGLIQDGYDDFGAYGLTATGFLDLLESANISLDTVFDGNTQDLIILGRLRQKAQQAQAYSTINNQYRRLVNINAEDEEEFLRIVGEIPPYLRLSNLLPAVATEMVNQTLQ